MIQYQRLEGGILYYLCKNVNENSMDCIHLPTSVKPDGCYSFIHSAAFGEKRQDNVNKVRMIPQA